MTCEVYREYIRVRLLGWFKSFGASGLKVPGLSQYAPLPESSACGHSWDLRIWGFVHFGRAAICENRGTRVKQRLMRLAPEWKNQEKNGRSIRIQVNAFLSDSYCILDVPCMRFLVQSCCYIVLETFFFSWVSNQQVTMSNRPQQEGYSCMFA